MENEKKNKIWVYILIGFLIFGWVKYSDTKEEVGECQDVLEEYQDALQTANQNIDEANSIIENAQSYAWSSYEDMGYVLDSLSTVDTVSEP